MAIDRRTFLALGGSALLTPWVQADTGQPLWVSTGRDSRGDYWLAGIDGAGRLSFQQPLPGRAHGLAIQNRTKGLVFARRPGNWAASFNPGSGKVTGFIAPPKDHRFVGHGCWRKDDCWVALGNLNSDARLGIWSGTRREWASLLSLPGSGAHEVVAQPNGQGIAVALGGLGNSDRSADTTFSSALLILNAEGRVRAELPSPGEGFSVRHLAADDRWVYVGLQYYGPERTDQPLVYRVGWEQPEWQPLPAEPWQWLQMNSYIASVVCYPAGVSVSSPRGHHLMHWQGNNPVRLEPMRDVAALAQAEGRLWAGNGLGQWRDTDLTQQSSRKGIADLAWDNHGAVA